MDSQNLIKLKGVELYRSDTKAGLPSTTLFISALLAFFTAYSHFFGLSYRKSYLEGAGFDSVNINLSPDESIYYAIHGFGSSINELLKWDMLSFELIQLLPGLTFTIVILSIWWIKKCKSTESYLGEAKRENNLLYRIIDRWTDTFYKSILLSLFSLVTGYIFQLAVAIVLATTLIFFWFLMALGILAGNSDGEKRVETPICKRLNWEEFENNIVVLGCKEIYLKGGNSLTGISLHRDSKINYFISNDGLYEISETKEILSFKPINRHLKTIEH